MSSASMVLTAARSAIDGDAAGLILAGGQASRMQRGENPPVDKGLLPLNDRPLVAHVQAQMKPWTSKVYVSANRNAQAYSQYGEVVADSPMFEVGSGPLAGIASVLSQIQQQWLFVWPVDVPVMPVAVVPRLREAIQVHGSRSAYLATEEGAHPLCLWLERSLADSLTQYLLQGGRKVQRWLDDEGACRTVVSPSGAELVNVNTPADLELLQTVHFRTRA